MSTRGRLQRTGRWRRDTYVPATKDASPEPGTLPIPEGTVRLYHYTNAGTAALAAIMREGIRVDRAQGNTYGEPDVVWASAEQPKDFKEFVEFWAKPTQLDIGRSYFRHAESPTVAELRDFERRRYDVTVWGNVERKQIIAIHEPWHHTYRYLAADPESARMVDPAASIDDGGPIDHAIRRYFEDHPA